MVDFAPFVVLLGLVSSATELPVIREEASIRSQETRRFEFGTVPQQDTTVLLEVTARLHYRGLGGSSFFMKLTLNGREVAAARSRRVMRLVNKPVVSPVAPRLPASWCGSGVWRLIYAPDFEMGRKASFYEGDPYTFVLDVTDLTNPAAENRLEITNMAKRLATWKEPEGNLVIQKLTIRIKREKSPTMQEASAQTAVINNGRPAAGPAQYTGELLPGGGFAIRVGAKRWEFASAFSYPDAGLNRLVPAAEPDRSGQPAWQPRVERTADGGSVLAEGPNYRLERRVRFTARKVEVADTLTNLSRESPLGLLVRHDVGLDAPDEMAVRLAGNPDPALSEYYSPPNPSVHIALGDQGLGLLCEDDVFRNQAKLFCTAEPATAGLKTEMLCLAPQETYTVRWSVYPVAGPDYFDFINLVREDWGSNHTVDGAWTFFSPDSILALPVETIREKFQRLGIRYACYCGGWVDPKHDRKRIGFGTGVLDDYWADFRSRLKAAAAKIHQAVPGVKVLVYYDTQRDTSEGGVERFRDSWLTDPKGNQLLTDWGGVYSRTWSVVATSTNSYGKAMLTAADRYLEEMKIDGLYWDEMENTGYGVPLVTYNANDGHSCLLDPKRYTIERAVGITTLLGEGQRLAVIERVRKQGGTLMGNGPAFTRAILATGVPRMVEIQHNDAWCYEGNLGTPLGYMSSRMDFGNFVRALRLACLPVGTNYSYAHEISRYLFPFTPIELHAGYLLGKERIVTLHPGSYGWKGQRCLVQVHHFDRDGKHTAADYPTTIGPEARTQVAPGEEEVVVLERLPIVVESSAENAVVRQVRYTDKEVTLQVTAPKAATLRLTDGPFPVRTGLHYAAQLGDDSPQTLAVVDGTLTLPIRPGQDVRVRVFMQ
jgi:hypothetical protein